jgi:hypothetical protein
VADAPNEPEDWPNGLTETINDPEIRPKTPEVGIFEQDDRPNGLAETSNAPADTSNELAD